MQARIKCHRIILLRSPYHHHPETPVYQLRDIQSHEQLFMVSNHNHSPTPIMKCLHNSNPNKGARNMLVHLTQLNTTLLPTLRIQIHIISIHNTIHTTALMLRCQGPQSIRHHLRSRLIGMQLKFQLQHRLEPQVTSLLGQIECYLILALNLAILTNLKRGSHSKQRQPRLIKLIRGYSLHRYPRSCPRSSGTSHL